MFDWIVEADIYRLKKAALEATSPRERRELEAPADRKLALLQRRAGRPETCSDA